MRQAVAAGRRRGVERTPAGSQARARQHEDVLVVDDGHRFPFQAQGPAQGSGASHRHSSAVAENWRFPLDEEAAFRGRSERQLLTLPRLCRTCGPPLRRAVSFLGLDAPRLSRSRVGNPGSDSADRQRSSCLVGEKAAQPHEPVKAAWRWTTLYRPPIVGHQREPYAVSAAGESWLWRTAAGVWNPCRSMSQVVL
jgi:hypothetical protein